jgi:hypothetical protein
MVPRHQFSAVDLEEPTAADVEDCDELFDAIERGQGVYLVVYDTGRPSRIFFAGYSYD